ncbi:MAG: hypothetical protein D5R99_01740 [Methanocalculus sp. MSAO_Arc1]|uniref:KEOPS complex subunit Pcc1 n=1 Tax=Methanocalculus TaxID=71151 RepID=UPI000FF58247|nr:MULTISPECIES: KEOPS complex subunit Pcc1 [unclassified Methanocalculus]MCP1663126.1 KEOPS complex subunit Pcc1 [Methanocalculus sp. AMF5]RQD81588.1 MAG: hypothetical protein D5R99_01740 [Methanocalculus sp. MSAO_Arc1]
MTHTAEFWFASPHAEAICQAVAPEMEDETGERSRATISQEGEKIFLTITAGDIPALRASLNMWLRLITIAEEMQEIDYIGKS